MQYPLVSPEWLSSQAAGSLVVADCRYDLLHPEKSLSTYNQGHINSAYFLDLEEDLCSPKALHGGRHPIPGALQFAQVLSRMGLTRDKMLVAYDHDGSGAAHLWWLCRYYGIESVAVLQGGLSAWLAAGLPLSKEVPAPQQAPLLRVTIHSEHIATRDDVLHRSRQRVLIDSRSYERYTGAHEPIDPIAGRIPGAIHADWVDVYGQAAEYHTAGALREHFQGVIQDVALPPIVYCGSGVSACSNILAMHLADIPAILYAGSYSDWISYDGAPIDQGDL
jgi:thiosulfate/3-mercaptopyruvate sulfurtransferase